jgi:hypothetical protein
MSSEFSCDYCSAHPRHPCYTREEASRCPNNDDQASCMDFGAREVAIWLRDQASWYEGGEALIAAAEILDGH